MRRLRIASAVAVVAAAAGPLAAAPPLVLSGSVDLRAGYGSNPFLRSNTSAGSPLVGATLNALLTRKAELSTTTLNGIVDIDQNFQHYGRAENYIVTLDRLQQITQSLLADIQASYQDTINARDYTGIDTTDIDLLSVGQRSRRVSVNGQLDWQATRRDAFRLGGNFSHATYQSLGARNFTQYGATAGYLRTLSARTKVGVQLTAAQIEAGGQPSSQSYQVSLQLVQQLSAIWSFDGSVGLILQKTGGAFSDSAKTIGFDARLCGKYPQYDVCLRASRQSAPSGFGGLRTDTQVGVDGSYRLSQRSRIGASATFDDSRSQSGFGLPRQRYYQVSGNYDRVLNDRLSAGFSGRYQRRDFGSSILFGNASATGYSVTADVRYKFGRLGT